jgi:hypothetical protein
MQFLAITPDNPPISSADPPEAGEIFNEISSGRDAFCGLSHAHCELTGAGDVLPGQNPT